MSKVKRPTFDPKAVIKTDKQATQVETTSSTKKKWNKDEKEKTKRVNVELSLSKHTELKVKATQKGETISDVIRSAINEYLRK